MLINSILDIGHSAENGGVILLVLNNTLFRKKKVCAQLFDQEKRFKICWKIQVLVFFHFSFRATLSFTLVNVVDLE